MFTNDRIQKTEEPQEMVFGMKRLGFSMLLEEMITTMVVSLIVALGAIFFLTNVTGVLSDFIISKLRKAAKKGSSSLNEAIEEAYSEISNEDLSKIKHEKTMTLDGIFNKLDEKTGSKHTDEIQEFVQSMKSEKAIMNR